MINRRTNIMNPHPVKHEWEVAGAIGRWEERYRTLHEEEKEECLPEKYRMVALRRMLTGDIKRHVDLHISKITGYDVLRSTIMKWAVDRKDDPMDTDHAEWAQDDEAWSWDTSSPTDGDWEDGSLEAQGDEAMDVGAVGKGGKGKGGKGGKSAGKGHWTPSAINTKLGA